MAISRYEVARLRTVVRRRGFRPGSLGGGLAQRHWGAKWLKVFQVASVTGRFWPSSNRWSWVPPFDPILGPRLLRQSTRKVLRFRDFRERQVVFIVVGREANDGRVVLVIDLVVPHLECEFAHMAYVKAMDAEAAAHLRRTLLNGTEARALDG